MSKYTYMNMNGSHGIILSHIKQGSTVLEMGCAAGHMTKYMHENLNCNVHIIEIDEDACKQATQYANDWWCGDLEDNERDWKAYYSQYKYDYILFADVLEHLKNPSEVLERAVTLLKDDGRVIISIPNICHNDILMQMYYNHWNYTGLGLLDNTHLRFWGKDELQTLVNSNGLMIESWSKVVIPMLGTEQRPAFKVNDDLIKLLRQREDGDVYQWIVTCKKG